MTDDHRFPEMSNRFRTVFVAAVITTAFPVGVALAMAAPVVVASVVLGIVAGWAVSGRRLPRTGRRRTHHPSVTYPGRRPPIPR